MSSFSYLPESVRDARQPRQPAGPQQWLGCRTRRPAAPLRLYCFPHAGGSIAEFLRWDTALPDVEVLGIHLPGRGGRMSEPAFTSVPDLVTHLLAEVTFQKPFAFFGHSLGAIIAYETTRQLRKHGREQPERLWLSAKTAPHHPHPDSPVRHLPDLQLMAELVRRYGGMEANLTTYAELLPLMVPACRGDLSMIETYRHQPGPPLSCPFTVLGGETDHQVPREQLADWREYTTGEFELRMFPGGHFYFRDHPVTKLIIT